MEAERVLRRTNVLLRRLGRTLSALINRATLYRFTDDALLLSSALAGIVVGLAIVVFHKVLELFELGWRMLSPEAWQATGIDHLSWTTLLVPLITAAGGFVPVSRRTPPRLALRVRVAEREGEPPHMETLTACNDSLERVDCLGWWRGTRGTYRDSGK